MGQMLYAVALKRRGGFTTRPTEEDLAPSPPPEAELARVRPLGRRRTYPVKPFPQGNDMRP